MNSMKGQFIVSHFCSTIKWKNNILHVFLNLRQDLSYFMKDVHCHELCDWQKLQISLCLGSSH